LKAALLSYNIATAKDISHSRVIDVQGFGPTYTKALVEWKESLVRKFRFDPSRSISQAEVIAVHTQFLQQALQVERTLTIELQQVASIRSGWQSLEETFAAESQRVSKHFSEQTAALANRSARHG
jgi:DNA-binding helix-hairpin-helix protein with protein kinase domain